MAPTLCVVEIFGKVWTAAQKKRGAMTIKWHIERGGFSRVTLGLRA